MKKRHGFVLPGVLLLIIILLLLAGSRHFFSRHQLNQADHGARYEKAYHMATGALEAADILLLKTLAFINDGRIETIPKRQKAPKELMPLVKAILDEDGIAYPRKEFIPIQSEIYEHLQRGWENSSTLKVELELRELEPLITNSGENGPVFDDKEKKILVMLHAEASVEGAFARVYRYREGRVINLLPSIISKFALFLRSQGSFRANTILDSNSNKNIMNDTPLMVFCGKAIEQHSLKPESTRILDKQGWVFLGSEASWRLGAGPGGNDSNHASGMLDRRLHKFAIPGNENLSATGYLSYYSQPEYLFSELKKSDYKKAMINLGNDQISASKLRISGSENQQTPTVILGKVLSRWALLQGLNNSISNLHAPLPMLNAQQFSRNLWPGMSTNAARKIKENFSDNYERYKERMSQIIEQSYNSGNLNMIAFENSDFSDSVVQDPSNLPADSTVIQHSSIAKLDNQPVNFFKINHGNFHEFFQTDNSAIFKGNLSGFENLSFLKARSGQTFQTNRDFFKAIFTKDKKYLIKDVYFIAGSLNIDRQLIADSGCGGMIIVEDNITISEKIRAINKEPIFLISLNGNITITTGQKLDAGIAALKGTVFIDSNLLLEGLLAAKELSIRRLQPVGQRKIIYNSDFDITDDQVYKRNFRFFMPEKGVTFVK